MKKNHLFLVLLAFSTIAKAQSAPEIQWQKSLGGSDSEDAYSVQQTSDGGFIVAGRSESTDGDVSENHGDGDYWVVKLDSSGVIVWEKSLGGSGTEVASSVQQTADGGYIVAGESSSDDGDVSGNHGNYDYWVVKLGSSGDIVWQKSLGGSGSEAARSVQQTADGGYIVAGYSYSDDGDVSGNNGSYDYWVVKLDGSGTIVWQKSLGGSGYDEAYSVQQTSDGGYIVAGYANSDDGDVSGNHGNADYWVVKLNGSGNIVWQKPLGGSGSEVAYSVQQTADGGYIVAGLSESNDGDVSGNHGNTDYWVVKLDSGGDMVWQKSLGGTDGDAAYSVRQTADGGYVVAGYANSDDGDVSGNHGSQDYWVVKLDGSGDIVWQKSLGGNDGDFASSIQQTADGGYIVAGYSYSDDGDVTGHHGTYEYADYWVVKLSADGMAVQDIAAGNLMMYPNPTRDFVNLQGLEKGTNIRIFDMSGKTVYTGTAANETLQISIQNLNSGIYAVEFEQNGKKYAKKLIVKE